MLELHCRLRFCPPFAKGARKMGHPHLGNVSESQRLLRRGVPVRFSQFGILHFFHPYFMANFWPYPIDSNLRYGRRSRQFLAVSEAALPR